MPGGGQPIVVGGGIQLAGGAIDEFLVLTSITPPTATTSPRIRRSGTTIIMESAAGRENTVIGPATTGSATNNPEILIGKTVTSVAAGTPSNLIGIGQNIGFTAASSNNVLIGHMTAGLFPSGATTGTNLSIIGNVVSVGGAFRNSIAAIGSAMTLGASNIVAIGTSVNVSGANSVAVGDASTASAGDTVVIGAGSGAAGTGTSILGRASTGTGTTTHLLALGSNIAVANLSTIIAIGNGVSVTGLAVGDIIIGHNNLGAGGFSSRVVWGGANLHTNNVAVPAWTFRHKNAQGANIAAGDVTWTAPLGTGTGVPGDIVFQTADLAAAGSTLQTAVTRMVIRGQTGRVHFSVPTGATHGLHVDAAGGAGIPWIKVDNLTTGAAAAVGTLNNAPAAGDPTFWMPIQTDGTVRYIPCW